MSQATKKALAATEAAAPIVRNIAPPYFGAGFSAFKSGPAPQGFWSAVGHDVTRGGVVVQLGGTPPPPSNNGSFGLAYAGFQYQFTTPANSYFLYYIFRATFNPGPVSNRNPGNYVGTYCEIRFPDIPQAPGTYPVMQQQQVVSNTPLSLTVASFLAPGKTYRVQVLAAVDIIRYHPTQIPYGEVILKSTDLQLTQYNYPAAPALKGKGAKAAAQMPESEPIFETVSSIEEAQEKGLTGTF